MAGIARPPRGDLERSLFGRLHGRQRAAEAHLRAVERLLFDGAAERAAAESVHVRRLAIGRPASSGDGGAGGGQRVGDEGGG
jgi:hypothetical protein